MTKRQLRALKKSIQLEDSTAATAPVTASASQTNLRQDSKPVTKSNSHSKRCQRENYKIKKKDFLTKRDTL